MASTRRSMSLQLPSGPQLSTDVKGLGQPRRSSMFPGTTSNMDNRGRKQSVMLNKLKKKRDGTPDKTTTPNPQDIIEENERPPSRHVLMNDEIASLAIKEEELQNLREPKPPAEKRKTPAARTVLVKKVPPASEWNKPAPKIIIVAKPAPPNAPLKPVDLSGATGPRFDVEGTVIPYSILGSLENYKQEAVHRGELQDDFEIPQEYRVSTPTVKYEKTKKSSIHPRMSSVDENNAIINWQKKMLDRKKQNGFISSLLQRPVEHLVMNQADGYRQTQEQRYIIDRTIPFVDYGKGYRVGSEFWKQQEPIGNELTGIQMGVTQTERGYPPPIEHIGIPKSIKQEKGTYVPNPTTPIHYPWHKSPYLADRKKQLQQVIEELVPHKPDIENLQIIGSNNPYERAVTPALSVRDHLGNLTSPEPDINDPLRDMPDVHPAPIFGPAIQFAGQPARWTGDNYSFIGGVGIEARVTFEAFAGERVTSFLEVKNDGTTSIYYSWKKLPKANPFDLVNAKVQRFYFNNSSGVILPGDTMKFPFVFKSPNAGVFTEEWEFETKPVVCGGASLVVTLRGIALQEDKYKKQRTELEKELAHRQSVRFIDQILNDVVDGIKTPERSRSPVDFYITDEEIFHRQNPGMHYNNELIAEVNNLHRSFYLTEETTLGEESENESPRELPPWDLSLGNLKATIMGLDEDDERKEEFLNRLNSLVVSLSFPAFTPAQQQMYAVGYQQLSELAENIVSSCSMLRNVMGLPEKELEEEDGLRKDLKSSLSHKSSARSGERTAKSGGKKGSDAKKSGAKDPKVQIKTTPAKDTGSKGSAKDKQPKKPPSRAGVSPVIKETPSLERQGLSPSSLVGSPIAEVDPVLEKKYKDKLYVQTYNALAEMFDRMTMIFEDIKSSEDTRNLEKLKTGQI